MDAADIKTNDYMSDNTRFADIFNFFLYDGEQVINPDNLRELDRTAVGRSIAVYKVFQKQRQAC